MAANLTQTELAGTTYSKSYISAIERGKMTPSLPALGILAERLGVTLAYLLGEELSRPADEAPSAPAEDDERAARLREGELVLQEADTKSQLPSLKTSDSPTERAGRMNTMQRSWQLKGATRRLMSRCDWPLREGDDVSGFCHTSLPGLALRKRIGKVSALRAWRSTLRRFRPLSAAS